MKFKLPNLSKASKSFEPKPSKHNGIIIAVDGPSASGKGTLAIKLAQHFHLKYMDTGKLYRILAAKIIDLNINVDTLSEDFILKLMNHSISHDKNINISNLRTEKVGLLASKLATKEAVRSTLLVIQRNFAYYKKNKEQKNELQKNHHKTRQYQGVVLDGRDIGSVVCPDADFKIFITAQPFIRARRRFKELKFSQSPVMYKYILFQLMQRDIRDLNRTISPLVRSKDAIYLDTSCLNQQQVLQEVMEKIKFTCNGKNIIL